MSVYDDVVCGLVGMGYTKTEAKQRASAALQERPEAALPELLTFALRPVPAAGQTKEPEEDSPQPTDEAIGMQTSFTTEHRHAVEPMPKKKKKKKLREFHEERQNETQDKARWHIKYTLLVGWWLALLVGTLRLLLYGIQAIFTDETKKDSTIKALLGKW